MINWTEELISEVASMLKDGMSYRVIAAVLSNAKKKKITKNMIVGAAHRHGLAAKFARSKRRIVRPIKPVVTPKPAVAPKPAAKEGVTHEVKGRTCLFLYGEPIDRNFCGKPAVTNSLMPKAAPVWCEHHLSIVYVQKSAKPKKVARRDGKFIIWENKY